MGKVELSIKDSFYENDRDIWNLLHYIVRDKKTGGVIPLWNTRGTLKNVEAACQQIISVQKFLEKDNERRMYHLVISFEKNIKDLDCIYNIAEDIADFLGKEYQLLYGIHTDKPNYHIHIGMSALNYKNGKKWHRGKKDVEKWINRLKKIAMHRLEVVVEIEVLDKKGEADAFRILPNEVFN